MPAKAGRALRIGVAGCGQMGRKHALNCSRLEGVSVVAVADTDQDRAGALAQETGAVPYGDCEAMLADAGLDAAIIATPPGGRRQAIEAAASAATPMLVEKPLALDMETARAFCDAARRGSVVNAVGFHLRYSPLTQRARALLSGRRVTHVRTVTTTSYYLKMDMPHWFLQRRHSGGPLLEQSLHVLDSARYLLGEITHVVARGDRLVRPDLGAFDSEDTIVLAYRFANGALGTHTDSCAMMEFNWEVELFGPDWRLNIDYARGCLRGEVDGETVHLDAAGVDLHLLEVRGFVEAVRAHENKRVLSSFADASRTLAVVTAADRALESGAWELVGG
ncbi:MAG: Gfo/Idh/MocA family oxidoreductase [Chloroflexi bacterium]|nr:Gfo/Idh/MocA family oxidoreductase [Chloroflexota bacterium]